MANTSKNSSLWRQKMVYKEKTLILSDGSTIEETFLLDPRFSILNGSLVIDLYDYPFPAFEEHVKNITSAKSAERDIKWWREF